MLSIAAVGWCHTVLRKPPYRCGDMEKRLRNDITVYAEHWRSTPARGAREGGFVECTCVCDSFDRMLSITAVGRYHPVLLQPRH